jgi:hypothetical protein
MAGKRTEAQVIINGVELSEAGAAVLRVAVHHFLVDLSDPAYRQDLGPIADAYEARLRELEDLLVVERADRAFS